MKDLNLRAIIIGCLVNGGVTKLLANLLGMVLGVIFVARNPTSTPLGSALASDAPLLLLRSLGLAVVGAGSGGFIAATLAPRKPIWNAIAVGVLAIFVVVLFMRWLPVWYSILSLPTTVGAAALGGWLRVRFMPPVKEPATADSTASPWASS